MQFLATFIQSVGYFVMLGGTLLCLSELIATMRVVARTEDREERMVAASGLIWYGGGPLIFISLYAIACLVFAVTRRAGWWVLIVGFAACTMPLVWAGLKGRRKNANRRIALRRY